MQHARKDLVSSIAAAILGCTGIGLVVGCAGIEPATQELLDASETRLQINDWAGSDAERCVYAAPNRQLCTWRLVPGGRGWSALAAPMGAEGELNLLCELPIDGSAREAGSCAAHPRAAHFASSSELPPVSAAPADDTLAIGRRWRAEQQLATAVTLTSLSRLVGEAPDRCRTGAGVQTCSWELFDAGAGHERVAALAQDAEAIQLRCVLPLDGTPRADQSCEVSSIE